MQTARVQAPPDKPLMIFDGDCRFCSFWIKRWRRATGDAIECVPFQNADLAMKFPELSRAQFEQSVHLIDRDGNVYRGAEAVFRSLSLNPRRRLWLRLYQNLPGFALLTEFVYRLVARHRATFSALTRLFFKSEN